MPPKSKSIYRQPGAKHFQLVHRSQRDPLIHDPDASQHVLKPFVRENEKKGKSRADLEEILTPAETDQRANVGEASLYGVYYDDTEYDYMQHLRQAGVEEEGVDTILIEAPNTTKKKIKEKDNIGIQLKDLPEGVLASTTELPRNYESQQAIPESLSGFQPDMDPHLRQVLEALEDDAFVDDDLEDDFFGELVAKGERDAAEDLGFEFAEDGIDEAAADEDEDGEEVADEELGWEERFARFKKAQTHADVDDELKSTDDFRSEGGDTVGGLPAMRRRKGTSDASGYSMSSSSLHRTDTLQTLDSQYDQVMAKEYGDEYEDEDEDAEEDDIDEVPDLILSRPDFENMMDEFLNDFELLGRKMQPKLEGDTGVEKLDTFRRALGAMREIDMQETPSNDSYNDDELSDSEEEKEDKWDCESILCETKTAVPQITIDPKTGLPVVTQPNSQTRHSKAAPPPFADDTSGSDTETEATHRQTIARPKNESKEDKKARKAAVKAERQARRVEKKATKEQFDAEMQNAKRRLNGKELRTRKL
ncbi:Low temperature viability protein-domain-containing protein [Schizophyllum amplum]|uniref:Low temperature viability protein-domain-containing protein n=1 Tax=Schizophyllum amplum TaxID=97359 RepID=A0A550C9S2_9AGAR|nr:Low temperature viability protein-domain-containing protein [Auriculariopsis ampla]